MTLLILFFALSIGFSFLCSILEAVLLSISPSFVKKQEKLNPTLYKDLEVFKSDIDRPLSAILTLNTVAHTVGAIGVGAHASQVFGSTEFNLLGLSLTAESFIAAGMTLAILILSEIIPKTIGANYWRSLASLTVKTLKILIKILLPLVWLSQKITRSLKNDKEQSVLSRSDFRAMTSAIYEDGVLNISESKVIQNVLNLPDKKIQDIMTPRAVMFYGLASATIEEFSKTERFLQFSRIPVFKDDTEEVVGVVLKSDLYQALLDGETNKTLDELKRPVSFVNEDEHLANFFTSSNSKRSHMHIVKDQYGSITGVVTLEDVLETILGYEIVDETDKIADLQTLTAKNSKKG